MDDSVVLEWILKGDEELFRFDCGDGVSLDCSDHLDSILHNDLESLFVVVIDDLLHGRLIGSHLLHRSQLEEIG